MAIRNAQGMAVSYDCSDLIYELEQDIAEFGNDLVIDVIVTEYCGVMVCKDYNFNKSSDDEYEFQLEPGEFLKTIPAVDLLEIYRQQDDIL